MTLDTRDPRIVMQHWIVCLHCDRGELSSLYDSRYCRFCLPDPRERSRREAVVESRLNRAQAAAGPPPQAPEGHVWLHNSVWTCAHLFAAGEVTSYCGKGEIMRPAWPPHDTPAPSGVRECRLCRRAHEAELWRMSGGTEGTAGVAGSHDWRRDAKGRWSAS